MYNIKALEEEWKRYNRKKKRPWFLLLFVVLVTITAVVVLIYIKKLPNFTLSKDKKSEHTVTTQKTPIVFIDKALTELEEKSVAVPVDTPMDMEQNTPLPKETDISMSSTPKKKLHIEVIEAGSSAASYKEIEKRFRLGHDTDDSLFLAKSYYRQGNYKKAEYWALQTNKVNGNIEESWLIFAKAKVKRGQRNEAIRILNAYIKRTRSVEAKVLLQKIKNRKI
jgi:tetratricopeptide (TPR) repeat protein